jgi:hypothetical protein
MESHMPSPTAQILDPASDVTREELARLSQVYTFPEFVKQADITRTMTPENVAVTTYADPVRNKYACHTAAATWLSGLYFHEKKAEYHPKDRSRIEQRLEHYADYWRIRPAYEKIVKRANDLSTQELPDSAYAYVWADERGGKERFLPLTSTQNIKAAAEWLQEYQDSLPFRDRNVIAKKILEKASATGASFGAELNQFVEKQAGYGIPDPHEIAQMLAQRAKLCKSAEHRDQIQQLAETVRGQSRISLQPDQLVKLAETVDMIDRAINLNGKYTDTIKRPEDVIFKVTYTKAASDRDALCTLQTGNIYEKDQLAKLAKEDIQALFGNDFAAEVSRGFEVDPEKMAAVAETLPRPDAELLEQMLAEAGQQPQFGKSAVDDAVSQKELEEMAALYDNTGT